MNQFYKLSITSIFIFLVLGCQSHKTNSNSSVFVDENSDSASVPATFASNEISDNQVGVYFMPSWNTSPDPTTDRDSFWSCLQDPKNCASLQNPGIWGPEGRIYNKEFSYEGPYLDRKPIKELKGFYDRKDPEVARKQLQYMKSYGIDFFVYNWFFGRHYYYHLDFAPQAKIYYPKGWKTDPSNAGRIEIPGLVEWGDQLEVLLAENAKLPSDQKMKFAINWCDDSNERWMLWLKIGSPDEMARKANFPGENPDRALYLRVHEKITQLWIDQYFSRDDYLKGPDGRPIVYFYFPQDTESRAAFYGISMKELINLSQQTAKNAGYPGIKFIAVTAGPMQEHERMHGLPTKWVAKNPKKPWEGGEYQNRLLLQEYVPRLSAMGFEGMTGYVYHNFMQKDNRSYADMRETYRGHWNRWSEYFKSDSNFEYQVPVAMGWDMRPAGGTWPQATGFPSEPYKDLVHSTKKTFMEKLFEAQEVSAKYRSSNGNTIMICCWNEYLEGNHIEPTVGHGFDYLESIKEVFGK